MNKYRSIFIFFTPVIICCISMILILKFFAPFPTDPWQIFVGTIMGVIGSLYGMTGLVKVSKNETS